MSRKNNRTHDYLCLYFIAKSLDYGKAQQLFLSIIEEFNGSRNEKSFEQLFSTK